MLVFPGLGLKAGTLPSRPGDSGCSVEQDTLLGNPKGVNIFLALRETELVMGPGRLIVPTADAARWENRLQLPVFLKNP
jgi:hypothetical protein